MERGGECVSDMNYIDSAAYLSDIEAIVSARSYITNHFIAAEECGELTQAISKMVRYIDGRVDDGDRKKDDAGKYMKLADHILEESADVLICIYTLMKIYGFSPEDLDDQVKWRMKRNLGRIG